FMSMYVTGRAQADPFGTLQDAVLMKAGDAPYKGLSDGPRAGDFSGISVDPAAPDTFWAANEYATSTISEPNWSTAIINFTLDGSIPAGTDPNRGFLVQVYLDLLKRQADSAGLAFWSGLLNQGISRELVVREIQNSLEYRTLVVQGLYYSVLGRAPDRA